MLVTFPNFAANIRIKSVTCNFLVKFLSTPAEISCFSIIICTIDDLVAKVALQYAKSCHCGEKTCRSLNHHPKKKEIYGVLARRLRRISRSLLYLRNRVENTGGLGTLIMQNIWCFGTQITQNTQILIVSAESAGPAWKIQGVLARRLRRIRRSLLYLRNLRYFKNKALSRQPKALNFCPCCVTTVTQQ